MTPSLVRRLPARRSARMRTSPGKDGEWRRSKRNCTAVDTLLTFWPPGPEARMKVSSISRGSRAMVRVISIMAACPGKAPPKPGYLVPEVHELQRLLDLQALDQRDRRLQIVAL